MIRDVPERPRDDIPHDPRASSVGVRPAAAGLAVIAVPRPEYPPAAEALDHARLVLDSLTQLTPGTIAAL